MPLYGAHRFPLWHRKQREHMPNIKNGPADKGRAGCAIGRRTQAGPTAKNNTSQSPCWLIHERLCAEHSGHEWLGPNGRLKPQISARHAAAYAQAQMVQTQRDVGTISDRIGIDPEDDVRAALEAVFTRIDRAMEALGEFASGEIIALVHVPPCAGWRLNQEKLAADAYAN